MKRVKNFGEFLNQISTNGNLEESASSDDFKFGFLNSEDLRYNGNEIFEDEIIQGKKGDPYEYKRVGDVYYTRKKGSSSWIKTSGKSSEAIATKIYKKSPSKGSPQNSSPNKSVSSKPKSSAPPAKTPPATKKCCEPHPETPDVDKSMEPLYQSEAAKLIAKGIPSRTACEISFIKIRPKFKGKAFFVIDTLQNLIYLFDKNGKFVAKGQTLDGSDAQSQDAKKIAQALWAFQERVEKMGFKYDPVKKTIIDSTGANRTYNHKLFYDSIDKSDSRFFPKGIYSISGLTSKSDYAGGANNVFQVQTLDGKVISQAIHGFYNEAPRIEALEKLKKAMGSKATSPEVNPEFIDLVEKYMSSSKFNKSYGCINVSLDFLELAKPHAVKGTLVFVIGETKNNYLVQNSEEFFDKMGNSKMCIDPKSLGKEIPTIDAIA
jgi:hypothetical protein